MSIALEHELLAPKEEPQDVMEQPQMEEKRGGRVGTPTQLEKYRERRNRTREGDRLIQDAQEHVGVPTSHHRKRRSPERYTSYMDLMTELIEIDHTSFEETVSQLVWVDAMVEENESIMKNSVWEVASRPKGQSMVGSKWVYKVKHATDGSIEKYTT